MSSHPITLAQNERDALAKEVLASHAIQAGLPVSCSECGKVHIATYVFSLTDPLRGGLFDVVFVCPTCWAEGTHLEEVAHCDKCDKYFPTRYSYENYAVHVDGGIYCIKCATAEFFDSAIDQYNYCAFDHAWFTVERLNRYSLARLTDPQLPHIHGDGSTHEVPEGFEELCKLTININGGEGFPQDDVFRHLYEVAMHAMNNKGVRLVGFALTGAQQFHASISAFGTYTV